MGTVAQNTQLDLKELRFSDLLLGEGCVFLKGVPGGKTLEPLGREWDTQIESLRLLLDRNPLTEFNVEYDGIRYRVSRIATTGGTWYALRRAMERVPSLCELGFVKPYVLELCSPEIQKGLVIFCGAMGSGKTTSASALVKKRLELHGGHAITLEDPPEMPLHGPHGEGFCLQKHVNDFGQAIVESLRYGAPEIIYLGELRAPNDVSQALRAAINGHLLIATIHAGSVIEAAQRILSLGSVVDGREMTQDLMAGGIGIFVHQRLKKQKDTDKRRLQIEFLKAAGPDCQSVRSHLKSGKLIQLGSAIMEQRNKLVLRGK